MKKSHVVVYSALLLLLGSVCSQAQQGLTSTRNGDSNAGSQAVSNVSGGVISVHSNGPVHHSAVREPIPQGSPYLYFNFGPGPYSGPDTNAFRMSRSLVYKAAIIPPARAFSGHFRPVSASAPGFRAKCGLVQSPSKSPAKTYSPFVP